jgi:hypothetical protein
MVRDLSIQPTRLNQHTGSVPDSFIYSPGRSP